MEKRRLRAGRLLLEGMAQVEVAPRVGRLFQARFGLRYSEPHLWRILRQLGFSPQRPSERALERDEDAIRELKRKRWRH